MCLIGATQTHAYVYLGDWLAFGKLAVISLTDFRVVGSRDMDYNVWHNRVHEYGGMVANGYGYIFPQSFQSTGDKWDFARFTLGVNPVISELPGSAEQLLVDHYAPSYFGGFTYGNYGFALSTHYDRIARFPLDFSSSQLAFQEAYPGENKQLSGAFVQGDSAFIISFGSNRIVKISLQLFPNSPLSTLEMPGAYAFYGGLTDGTFGYVINTWSSNHIYRFHLETFSQDSVTYIDLSSRFPNLGLSRYACFSHGGFGYFQTSSSSSLAVYKFSQIHFNIENVQELYISAKVNMAEVAVGAFTDGVYGYLMGVYRDVGSPWPKIVRFEL